MGFATMLPPHLWRLLLSRLLLATVVALAAVAATKVFPDVNPVVPAVAAVLIMIVVVRLLGRGSREP